MKFIVEIEWDLDTKFNEKDILLAMEAYHKEVDDREIKFTVTEHSCDERYQEGFDNGIEEGRNGE